LAKLQAKLTQLSMSLEYTASLVSSHLPLLNSLIDRDIVEDFFTVQDTAGADNRDSPTNEASDTVPLLTTHPTALVLICGDDEQDNKAQRIASTATVKTNEAGDDDNRRRWHLAVIRYVVMHLLQSIEF
jgi:hypothetical protein